jgi:RecA/RadA recombinase
MQLISGKQTGALKIALYAPEGIGKTTYAAQMPNPVFIDTEGGSGFLDVVRTPRPTSWSMLMSQVQYFISNPQALGTLVIDTLDWAERLCIEQFCASRQIKGIEDMPYGKGYVYVAEEFGRFLNLLEELRLRGVHIFMTAHAAIRKFEQPDELGSYDKWEMKLSKKVAPMVKEFVDALFFANYETFVVKSDEKKNKVQGGRRVMYTSHHSCWDAKNRYGLPEKLPLEFSAIAGLFGSSPTPVPVQPAQAAMEGFTPITEPDPDLPFTGPTPPNGIPADLWDLMHANGVTERELQDTVGYAGYFPADMPIRDYPEDFVRGCLVGAWDSVYTAIKSARGGN